MLASKVKFCAGKTYLHQ